MKRLLSMLAILAIPLLIAAGCSNNTAKQNKETVDKGKKMDIYTSIYPLEYLTKQIGGGRVNVQSVYPPGVDAHTYEPTSKTVTDIAKSDAFIYMGAGMEGFAETTADALKKQDVETLEIGRNDSLFIKSKQPDDHDHGVHEEEAHDEHGEEGHEKHEEETNADHDEHDHGDKDPHVWLDPLKMIEMGEMIKDNLSEWDPKHKDDFTKNFNRLKENMTDLDKDFVQTLENNKQKHILVTHAAYGYWERYGIEQLPIRGLSTSDEPSQKELAKTTRLAEELDLHYIIYEKSQRDRLGKVIQQHIHAKPLQINNLEVLSEADVKQDKDYLKLMREDLAILKKATTK